MEFFVSFFVAMLSMVNPIGLLPHWIALTDEKDKKEKNTIAKKVLINSIVVMLGVVFIGQTTMAFFGITLDAVRLAGSLMIVIAALNILSKPVGKAGRGKRVSDKIIQESKEDDSDISFIPFTMPLICGPGTMAVILAHTDKTGMFYSSVKSLYFYGIMVSVVVILSFFVYFSIKYSDYFYRLFKTGGISALTKIMGFVLLCIGAQLFITSFKSFLN